MNGASEVSTKIKIAMALALALAGPAVPEPAPAPQPGPSVKIPEDGARDGEWTFRRDPNHEKGGYWFRYVTVTRSIGNYPTNSYPLPRMSAPFPYRVGAVNRTSSNCST